MINGLLARLKSIFAPKVLEPSSLRYVKALKDGKGKDSLALKTIEKNRRKLERLRKQVAAARGGKVVSIKRRKA